MARINVAVRSQTVTHEGGKAQSVSPLAELRRTVLTCMLFEDTFYEKGSDIAQRIEDLSAKVTPEQLAEVAIEARDGMKLRHVPLFLVAQLSKREKSGPLVESTLTRVIQRADELGEFISIYWQHGARSGKPGKHPLSAGVKRGLAAAFRKFDAYQLGKYNGDPAVKLRDVLFLVHGKPKDEEQAATWKRLVEKSLESPDTWEVALSAGADKKETFERLMREGKLGGLAVLRNLRNMLEAGVGDDLIRARLGEGITKALPFRFVTAARYAPRLEDAIESAMLKAIEGSEPLPGRTGLLIDVSGSMDYRLGNHKESPSIFQSGLVAAPGETSRIDVASALAILMRERAPSVRIATFSTQVVEVPPRRGFALRDAIVKSQAHGGTHLAAAVSVLEKNWTDIDRLIVITDEQSQDGNRAGFAKRNYLVNVAPYKNGVSYGNGWHHIDGWSEKVLDYIAEYERTEASA
jgi:60 kDa SS-A/Ro ribonucleoprotein